MDQIEKQPLILNEDHVDLYSCAKCRRPSQVSFCHPFRRWIVPVLTHAIVFFLTLVVFNLSSITQSTKVGGTQSPSLFSPVSPAVRFKIDTPPRDYWDNQLFVGEPNDESEIAWNNLLHPHGIRIFTDEAARLNITESVSLPNDDFVVIPGVNHNLHCVRRLRQFIYEDHYYPNMTAEQRERFRHHNVHCLETLRTSVMCHPDLTMLPYFWSEIVGHALTPRPNAVRECVDWEALQSYMEPRKYDTTRLVRDGASRDVA